MDLFYHLLSFAAPALAVALAVALAARVLLPAGSPNRPGWRQVALNTIAGVLVLAAGLWHFGVDGKMATYAALVAVAASCQWLSSRAWRR